MNNKENNTVLQISFLILISHILLITYSNNEQLLKMLEHLLIVIIVMNSNKLGPDQILNIMTNIWKS